MSNEYMSTSQTSLTERTMFDSIPGVSRRDQFAYLLRSGRERLGLTLEETALRCDLEPGMWAALERGHAVEPGWAHLEPSWSVLERIGAVIDVNPAVLMLVGVLSACARRYGLD